MSALPPIADIRQCDCDVGSAPKADIGPKQPQMEENYVPALAWNSEFVLS